MMTFRKRLIMACLFLAFCLTPAAALAVETSAPAPDFTLESILGEQVSLSDFKGRMVLLKLATTWCPTCKELDLEIEKAGNFLKENDVVVLEVFVQDSREAVEDYLDDTEFLMTFHALLDDGQAHRAYNVYLIPRLLVIDADQVVRFDNGGGVVPAEGIRSMIEKFSRPAALNGSS